MIERPQFKPHFRVEVRPPDVVYLLSERGHAALSGRLYASLAPLLDGHRTVGQIAAALREEASVAEVYYALMQLERKGYVGESAACVAPEVAAFWSALDQMPATAIQRLEASTVALTALGGLEAAPFEAALAALGIGAAEDGELQVVLTDDYLRPELDACNRAALAAGRSWLLVKPTGTSLWIGPLFRPVQTGCWECLAQRLRGNREVEAAVGEAGTDDDRLLVAPPPAAALPGTLQAAWGLAATHAALAILRGEGGPLDGRLVTLDLATLETRTHALLRRPQCPACGWGSKPQVGLGAGSREPGAPAKPALVTLESRPKRFRDDGGHRTCSPEETLRRYERHVSPITGAVSVLRPSSSADDGPVHTYLAGHNFGCPGGGLRALRHALRSKSAGKGKSDAQAKASGLCEALERYSGLYQGDEPTIRASFRQLGKAAIHPNACLLFSEAQYRQREAWNADTARFHWVPVPFDETQEIDWTPVASLTQNETAYLPTAFCYYRYPLPQEQRFCNADSNGNAAGNTLEEAILQGFLELVERDSVALWWYNRVARPGVDLESFGDPYLLALRQHYRERGREYWALDLTSDLGIPAFAAISRRGGQAQRPAPTPKEAILMGFGAHLDPCVALLRAVTEMNQMLVSVDRPAVSNGVGAEGTEFEQDVARWVREATLESQPYLPPDACAAPRTRADFPRWESDDLRDDVLTCVEIARQHGMETFVLDQTRPDIELRVVKVIVPGMRHFWRRLAPGRLYDAPVALGWLLAPLAEEQLNPISMFL